jgi:hypothetical protein
MRLLGVLVIFTACHGGGMEAPDASAGDADGSDHGLGILVAWQASPALPGALNDKITISDVSFQLKNFQLLADAGGATHAKYLLTWSSLTEPPQDSFPDAPAGVYSKVSLDMGGTLVDYAYQLHGTWKDDGNEARQFLIEDHAPFTVDLDCHKVLVAAGSAELAVRIDLRDALNGVDFDRVEEQDNVLVLDNGNAPQLGLFRDRLQRAFKIGD